MKVTDKIKRRASTLENASSFLSILRTGKFGISGSYILNGFPQSNEILLNIISKKEISPLHI